MWLCDRDTLDRLCEIDWEWLEEHRELIESGDLYEMGLAVIGSQMSE